MKLNCKTLINIKGSYTAKSHVDSTMRLSGNKICAIVAKDFAHQSSVKHETMPTSVFLNIKLI